MSFPRRISKDNGEQVAHSLHSNVQLLYSAMKAMVLCRSRRYCRPHILKFLLYRIMSELCSRFLTERRTIWFLAWIFCIIFTTHPIHYTKLHSNNSFAPCKVTHDSLWFGILWCGLRNPRTGFKIPTQWVPASKKPLFRDSRFLDMDSGFRRVGFRIPKPGFWIPKSGIPDSTIKYLIHLFVEIKTPQTKCHHLLCYQFSSQVSTY